MPAAPLASAAPLAAAAVTRARSQFVATVAANIPLCSEHYRLVLRLEQFPATEPGQFVQIACRDLGEDETRAHECEVDWHPGRAIEIGTTDLAGPMALLRRPFSLAGRRDRASATAAVATGAGPSATASASGSAGGTVAVAAPAVGASAAGAGDTGDRDASASGISAVARGDAGAGGVELDIIHRVVGVGTDWLSRLRPGDRVHILGPLGNTFRLPAPEQLAVLVGGGVGIPPMLYLAEKLAARRAVAFCGALRRDLLPLTITADASPAAEPTPSIAEFARHGIPSVITTDDGSYGFRGFVTQALERYLDSLRVAAGSSALGPVIYTCGPELMMKRVAHIAAARGLECQIAVERAMACGMGTCQSCCIKVRKPDPAQPPLPGSDWCYRLACTDGPVFRGSELLW